MDTFLNFCNKILLNEHALDEVPRKALGMFTSVQDLPMEQPYGFWVDRSGNFIPVKVFGHGPAMENIIDKAEKILKKKGIDLNLPQRYGSLFGLGWMRVVIYEHHDGVAHYEFGITRNKPTTSQMKFLKLLVDMYDLKGGIHGD